MTNDRHKLLHTILALGGFGLWAFLLVAGRSLNSSTTFALLLLILACAGFAQLASDLMTIFGGGGGGGGRGDN